MFDARKRPRRRCVISSQPNLLPLTRALRPAAPALEWTVCATSAVNCCQTRRTGAMRIGSMMTVAATQGGGLLSKCPPLSLSWKCACGAVRMITLSTTSVSETRSLSFIGEHLHAAPLNGSHAAHIARVPNNAYSPSPFQVVHLCQLAPPHHHGLHPAVGALAIHGQSGTDGSDPSRVLCV